MSIKGNLYDFTLKNVNIAPEQAGVYALFANGVTIYIGRARGGSVTIRSRLQDHKSGSEGICTQTAKQYKREVCSNPVAREKQLLQEYLHSYGKLPRCNDVMP